MSLIGVHMIAALACRETELQGRHSKAGQRSLAAAAMERARRALGGECEQQALTSISHSRGVALAVIYSAPEDGYSRRTGCDVESADAPRRWPEIGAFLTGERFAGDASEACRAWTLAEAWFKAFQVWPATSLVRRAVVHAADAPDGAVIPLASSVHWYAFEPVVGFQASIVWRGERISPQVTGDGRGDATSGSAP